MHAEYIDVTTETIKQLIAFSMKTVVAVGTTSLRTIESLYWMGIKLLQLQKQTNFLITVEAISIQQWDAYQLPQFINTTIAIT